MPTRPAFVAAILLAGCAASPALTPKAEPPVAEEGPPRYRVVHIDVLAPERFASFESARKEWVETLARVHGSDLRGAYFEMEHVGFLGVRPMHRFAELDARKSSVEAAMRTVPKAAGDAYDAASDAALIYPHTSEIWRLDDELSYAPPAGALTETSAGFFTLSMLEVKADAASEETFWSASKDLLGALATVNFPLQRLTFETSYGTGRVYALWLAPTRAAFDAAPTVERALGDALGEEKAKALLAKLSSAVLKETKVNVIRRRDLDSPS